MADRRITLEIDGTTWEAWQVHGRLAIGELFRLQAQGRIADPPAAADVLGKKFTLKVVAPHGETLPVLGIVTAVSLAPMDGVSTIFEIELSPEVAALDLGQDSYVFQEKSVPDVLKDVLDRAGIASEAYELRLSGSYDPHPYIAQYRESDWAFVSRLCAEEGIYWWFELEAEKTKLVLGDDSTNADPIAGGASIPFRDEGGAVGAEEHVSRIQHTQVWASDAVRFTDYNFETPAVKLDSSAKDGPGKLERYDFPGEFGDKARGDALAKLRLEAFRARRETIVGDTNGPRVTPGHKLEIAGHSLPALNAEWLCTWVEYTVDDRARGDVPSFRARFGAIPAKTPFRQPLRAPVDPGGPQTAVVSGPNGQEIHSDDTGRVRAQFHWDRVGKKDDKASTFMRVGQVPLGGSMVMPRIGWEVLVSHHDGDADYPFIDAHLYEGEHPVPYALPANKTRTAWQTATTPGDGTTNEMRFEDKAGSEEMFVNSSKDTKVVVGDNKAVQIHNNHTYTIGANEDVKVGSNYALQVDADQTVSIGATETLTCSAKRVVTVKASATNTIGAARTATVIKGIKAGVDGARTATIGASMTSVAGQKVGRSAIGSFTATIGAAWISVAGKDSSDMIGGAGSETVGGARIVMSGSDLGLSVKGAYAETVGGAGIVLSGAELAESSTGAMAVTVGGAFMGNAPKVVIEADSEISLRCGGSSIKITSGCIEIKSPTLASPGAMFNKKAGNIHHNP
jgi:type VI secretion system secreted protein VgrG